MSDELRKTCMECWRLSGYCQPAPTMPWSESCEHLKAIGVDIRRKLAKQRQFDKED